MWRCPKCSKIFEDGSRICRECGAILEEESPREEPIASESETDQIEPASPAADLAPTDDKPPVVNPFGVDAAAVNVGPWRCARCAESVPGNFDVCWNCGADRQGVQALDESALPEAETVERLTSAEAVAPPPLATCAECQADAVIQGLPLVSEEAPGLELKVVCYGNPSALVFKDPFFGSLRADVCGHCGHVRFRVINADQLLENYVESGDLF